MSQVAVISSAQLPSMFARRFPANCNMATTNMSILGETEGISVFHKSTVYSHLLCIMSSDSGDKLHVWNDWPKYEETMKAVHL